MKFIISAGHRKGEGANSSGLNEGTLTIAVRDELKKLYPSALYVPDNFDFNQTINFAVQNAKRDDIALDIHFNYNVNSSVKGTEAYYSDAKDLAVIFAERVSKELGTLNRGAIHEKYSYYGRLGFLHLPCKGVIIEGCYLTNFEDRQKLDVVKIARGIYNAIILLSPNVATPFIPIQPLPKPNDTGSLDVLKKFIDLLKFLKLWK